MKTKVKESRTKRAKLKEQGICIACGVAPATLNLAGEKSVRCDACRISNNHNRPRSGNMSAAQAKIVERKYDVDGDLVGYWDSPAFLKCKAAVDKVFDNAKRPLSIGDVMNLTKRKYPHQWVGDSIDLLPGVSPVPFTVKPERYAKQVRRVVGITPFRAFNNGISPTDRTQPMGILESERRILA